MNIIDLQLKDYKSVWDFQKETVLKRSQNEIEDTLILVEHPHVITTGRRSNKEAEILNAKCPVFEVERGGQVTYHGPGQLVGYPILHLAKQGRGIKKYMHSLEALIIKTLSLFDIQAGRKEGATGVWVKGRKIASIGVAVKKWVSYHGFALNVNTDLSYFEMIQPCGFESSVMTSMEKILNQKVDMEAVKRKLVAQLSSSGSALSSPGSALSSPGSVLSSPGSVLSSPGLTRGSI